MTDTRSRWWVHWWPLWVFLVALAVRLHWNLEVHPIGDFHYSDMKGYSNRANRFLDNPLHRAEYSAFFPYGTSWIVAGVKAIFGRENFTALGCFYALVGALNCMVLTMLSARLSPERPWVSRIVGMASIGYYPLIALGGYILSGPLASLCLSASALLLVRLAQEGRNRDAWWLGVVVAIGCTIRPQILLGGVLFFIVWLVRRKWYPKIGWPSLVRIGVPIAVVLAFSAVRLHHHTGRLGLVSENGGINLVFGRCHNKGLYSRPDGTGHGTVRFAPPPLIQLEKRSAKMPESPFQLRPVFDSGPVEIEGVDGFDVDAYGCTRRSCRLPGSELQYKGYIGDKKIQRKIVGACLRQAGVKRQAYYSIIHVIQLWTLNAMWPDQADPRPRPEDKRQSWRAMGHRWQWIHNIAIAPAAVLCMFGLLIPLRRLDRAAQRNMAAVGLATLHAWALVLTAAVYVGGIRFRVPYDGVLLVLAAHVYGFGFARARALIKRLVARE